MVMQESAGPREQTERFGIGYIPTLDGWRAIAIAMVLANHSATVPDAERFPWLRAGVLGVWIFFAISGFLICSRLLGELGATGRISLSSFYTRRAFRILPPYVAYLCVLALLSLAGFVRVSRAEWISCVTFTRNYLPEVLASQPFTGHLWSLAVEEHFYLIFPALLIYCGVRRAAPAIIFLSVMIAAWRFVGSRIDSIDRIIPGLPFHRTDTCLDALLLGCLFAILIDDPARRTRAYRLLTVPVWLGLLGAYVALVVLPIPLAPAFRAWIAPALLVGTALRPGALPGRILEWGPLRWIGRLSYSLYLWQTLFLVGGMEKFMFAPTLQTRPMNLLAVFTCAILSHYLIEQPAIRLGRSIARERSFQAVSPAPMPS
jgi:peptidoglycan/LPS O-acetylase OafA/YrhL